MSATKTITNMRALKRALDVSLLPRLSELSWTGPSVGKLHKACNGVDAWTFMLGWPKGIGPTGCVSIDVGVAPPLPGLERRDTLKRLCNGWDETSLVYHLPPCWHRRFPENPVEYAGRDAEQLTESLLAVYHEIDGWAKTCSLEQLVPLAEEMTRSEYAYSRKRGRDWQRLLVHAGVA